MSQAASPRLLRRLVATQTCRHWLEAIDACCERLPPDHADRQPTSDSLRLAALPAALFEEMRRRVARALPGDWQPRDLGVPARWIDSECWARRQHPPGLRPAGCFPHHWHQDGALGRCFSARPEPLAVAPRAMLTVWVPLVDCGHDAPSLEWIAHATRRLLHPGELEDIALLERFGAHSRRCATLGAGDALVFDGAMLHRTYIHACMTRRRVSVEFRVERMEATHSN